jgi:hypothetical protein
MATGGAILKGLGVMSQAARDAIVLGTLGGGQSAEKQDWSSPGQATANTLLDTFGNAVLGYVGGKAGEAFKPSIAETKQAYLNQFKKIYGEGKLNGKSLDDEIISDWNASNKPKTEPPWLETESDIPELVNNGGNVYTGDAGEAGLDSDILIDTYKNIRVIP